MFVFYSIEDAKIAQTTERKKFFLPFFLSVQLNAPYIIRYQGMSVMKFLANHAVAMPNMTKNVRFL